MGDQPTNPDNPVNAATPPAGEPAEAGTSPVAEVETAAPATAQAPSVAAPQDSASVAPAGAASAAADSAPAGAHGPGGTFAIPEIAGSGDGPGLATMDLLDDVDLDVKVELGRTEMYIEDVLRLGVGSVVELNKLAGDPVDVYVNSRLVARGEVLVLNDNFCVRISDIVSPLPDLA